MVVLDQVRLPRDEWKCSPGPCNAGDGPASIDEGHDDCTGPGIIHEGLVNQETHLEQVSKKLRRDDEYIPEGRGRGRRPTLGRLQDFR